MKRFTLLAAFLPFLAFAQSTLIPSTGSPVTPVTASADPTPGASCSNYFAPTYNWLTGALYGCATGTTVRLGSQVVAKADATVQSANIAATNVYTVPANAGGVYRASCYLVETQAATSSSTLPVCQVIFTDNDVNAVSTNWLGSTNTGNFVLASNGGNSMLIDVRAGSVVQYTTAGYVSSGATALQYAVHFRLEYVSQ